MAHDRLVRPSFVARLISIASFGLAYVLAIYLACRLHEAYLLADAVFRVAEITLIYSLVFAPVGLTALLVAVIINVSALTRIRLTITFAVVIGAALYLFVAMERYGLLTWLPCRGDLIMFAMIQIFLGAVFFSIGSRTAKRRAHA